MEPANEDFNEKLQGYRKALEQEYGLAEGTTPEDLETIRKAAAGAFLKAVPEAVRRIVYLMEHADKEPVQLASAKFIVQQGLQTGGIGEASDPLTELLKQLSEKANPA